MDFTHRYRGFFQCGTRSVAESAIAFMRGLFVAERRNLQQISESLDEAEHQNLQYLLSEAKWDHLQVLDQVARDANQLLGGHDDSVLIIDESGFSKKGRHSAGVARQWNGRMGKVDNCQVGVFAALSHGSGVALISARLYLPKSWIDSKTRCDKAHIPETERVFKTKSEIGTEQIRAARKNGVQFKWVGVDAGYGKEPGFLRDLDDEGERFMANVHSSQRIFMKDPKPVTIARSDKRGKQVRRLVSNERSVRVDAWTASQPQDAWQRLQVRHATTGPIMVEALHSRVWLWDRKETQPREWTFLVIRNPKDHTDIHYSLTNAAANTPLLDMVRIERQRYWIENALGDAKSEIGLAHYEVRTWVGWHRHMTLCMMASLFSLTERSKAAAAVPLLSTRDVRCILADLLIRPDQDRNRIFEVIANRHRQRWESTVNRYEKLGITPQANTVDGPTM